MNSANRNLSHHPGRGKRVGRVIRRNQGFSFLELVVVMTMLAVLTAIIIPAFGASVTAMKHRSARGDFVALLYFVGELAVRESREVRLYIDDRQGTYWVEAWVSGHGDDKVFEPLDDRAHGGVRQFPAEFDITRLRARQDRGQEGRYIAFYPSGACDQASIRIANGGRGEGSTTIATTGALGQVAVTP